VIEVRWHGRGGQGVVTSSQLLAFAAIQEGKYAIHIPQFGPERRGAPVQAFTRISDDIIQVRCGVLNPDIVVVIDPSLLQPQFRSLILSGVKDTTKIIYNTPNPDAAKPIDNLETYVVDAFHIALEVIGRPIYNTAMLGALVGVTKLVELESVLDAVKRRFSGKIAEVNVKAVERGFKEVRKIE